MSSKYVGVSYGSLNVLESDSTLSRQSAREEPAVK